MNILKYPICAIKGHDINPNETITPSMRDNRNWLCRCHRCGLYEMHDGATSGISITLTAKSAKRTAREFEAIAAISRYEMHDRAISGTSSITVTAKSAKRTAGEQA